MRSKLAPPARDRAEGAIRLLFETAGIGNPESLPLGMNEGKGPITEGGWSGQPGGVE